MPASKLTENFKSQMAMIGEAVESFPWHNRMAYALWLAQSYYFVRYSTRLLALGAGRAPLSHEKFHQRMVAHLKEEAGHEKLALMDLKSLGVDLSRLPESHLTKTFYQSQFYWILHRSPTSLLGWILFLEGLAASRGHFILEKAKASHGEDVLRFLKVHAEEDQAHVEKAFKVLEGLSEDELSWIQENMSNSAALYRDMLLEIKLSPTLTDAPHADH